MTDLCEVKGDKVDRNAMLPEDPGLRGEAGAISAGLDAPAQARRYAEANEGYPASCEVLRSLGFVDGPSPSLLARMPAYDDEELGVEFFRMHVEGADLSALTLPRTFFGRETASPLKRDLFVDEA
jgi:hypothetical protein